MVILVCVYHAKLCYKIFQVLLLYSTTWGCWIGIQWHYHLINAISIPIQISLHTFDNYNYIADWFTMWIKFQSYYWKRLLHELFRTYSLYFFSMFKKYYQGYWWVIGKVILIYSVPYIFYNEFFTSGLPTSVLRSWTWKSFLFLEHLNKSTPPIFIEDLMIWWLYSLVLYSSLRVS